MLPYVVTLMLPPAARHAEDRASMLHRERGGKSNATPVLRSGLLGFSMVELLITIIIVGILASIAIPSFSALIAEQRIKNVSFDIMSMLTLARSEAVKRNADVRAVPAGGWQNGWSVSVVTDGTVLSQQSTLPGVTITGPANITYTANGHLSAAVAPFEISSTSTTSVRCISIDLNGRPNSKVGSC